MKKEEIKKELYKQKPIAHLRYIRKGIAYYLCQIESDGDGVTVHFEIPIADMGDADFTTEMDAKLLNRWIV